MGAALRLPFARVDPWPSGLDALRGAGFQILALTPAADAVPLDEIAVKVGSQIVLLLGSEGLGLGDATMRYADMKVRIPVDALADSLNVVVATAIALHALRVAR
jgi:tRNA G18 (ribose-2'-O)-methylase SpoU